MGEHVSDGMFVNVQMDGQGSFVKQVRNFCAQCHEEPAFNPACCNHNKEKHNMLFVSKKNKTNSRVKIFNVVHRL